MRFCSVKCRVAAHREAARPRRRKSGPAK
jgi:hypothetical protein